MSLKQILKEARSNIDSNNFKEGLSLSLKALSLDKSNYTAFLFAALSSASLNSIPDAVSFYQSAITVDPLLPAAHQGLLKITDPTNSLYFNSLISLIDIFSTIDPLKCYNHIRTLILHSTNSTVIDSLLLLSPTSKYYNYLKSLDSLPSPLEIYSEAAEKQESIDLKTTNQEIDARRSRLNSDPIAVIKSSVESKVTLASRLDFIYSRILELDSLSQETRDEYNLKLLSFLLKKLSHVSEKNEIRSSIQTISYQLFINNSTSILPYQVMIEFSDAPFADEQVRSLMLNNVLDKTNSLYLIVDSFFKWSSSRDISCCDTIIKALETSTDSLLGYHILSKIYVANRDYETSLDCLVKARHHLTLKQKRIGVVFPNIDLSLDLLLAESYLGIGSRSNTGTSNFLSQAMGIYNKIIEKVPGNSDALKGLAMVSMNNCEYNQALDYFNQIDYSNDFDVQLEVSCLKYKQGNLTESIDIANKIIKQSESISINNEILSTCYFQIARVYWEMGGEYQTNKIYCFSNLLSSAKKQENSPNAFIYLGLYYHKIQQDLTRSIKCYQKAHDLITSGSKLFDKLDTIDPSKNLIELLISNLSINNAISISQDIQKSKPRYFWGWKINGILELKRSNFEVAAGLLQNSLRIFSNDSNCWEILADVYSHQGKFIAALKAYNRAIEIDDSVYSIYQIGCIYLKLGQFNNAIEKFNFLFDVKDMRLHVAIVKKLSDALILSSRTSLLEGSFGKACVSLVQAINSCANCISNDPEANVLCLFANIGICCGMLRLIPAYHNLVSIETLNLVVNISSKYIKDQDSLWQNDIYIKILSTGISAYKSCVAICQSSEKGTGLDTIVSLYYHDIGLLNYWIYEKIDSKTSLTSSINYIKNAIAIDSSNPNFWNSLGIIIRNQDPQLSQHSFIKAIELDSKSALYWTNLGYFYLQLSEFQLSLDSFSNAQSIDPDNIHAWFGPALIALLKQDSNVFNLFEYLLELNGDFVPEISLEYSNLFFEKYVNDSLIDVSVFTVPIFCLNKYIDRVWCLNCVSRDVGVALNLLGLLYEKVGSFDDSIACFIKCRGILDEPVVSLNLARVLLTRGDTLEALEIYQSNIKSIENNGVLESSLGMALFHSNKVPECLEWLEKGLKSSRKSNEIHQDDIAIVLSQVLFSLDTEQDIVKSREILQSIISSNPSHVKALLALGNGAVLKNDMQIAQQVASLLLIITPDVIGAVFLELVNSFMSRFFSLMGNQTVAIGFLSRTIHTFPFKGELWSRLGKLISNLTPGRFKSASSACDSATFLSLQSLNKEIVREIFLNNGLTILEKGSTLSDINLAKKSIFKAIKASPGSLDVWFALSIILRAEFIFKNTTSSKDVSKLNSVLSFISKSSDSHIQASRRLRNREKTVYLESIALWTRLLIAECMIWSKNDDEIDKAFEIIEGIKSKDSSIKIACLVLTARAFKTIGNEKNSIHFFKKACASSGSPSYCWEELASLYCEKDMFKAAELCLLKAVKASKGSLSCLAHSQLAILGLTVKNNSLASDSIAELNKLGAVDTSKFLQAILQFRGGNASKASKTLESVGDSVWKDWLNGLINI